MAKNIRRGFTLIELVVVMSMMMVILSLAGMTFHLLLRTEKVVSQSFVTERAISRLSVQFRDDVHRSERGELTGDIGNEKRELTLGDASGIRIRYAVTADGIARLLVDRDAVVARDDFRLPECHVSIAAEDIANLSLRTLVIERPGAMIVQKQQAPPPLRPLRIEAHLNRQGLRSSASARSDNETTTPLNTSEEQK